MLYLVRTNRMHVSEVQVLIRRNRLGNPVQPLCLRHARPSLYTVPLYIAILRTSYRHVVKIICTPYRFMVTRQAKSASTIILEVMEGSRLLAPTHCEYSQYVGVLCCAVDIVLRVLDVYPTWIYFEVHTENSAWHTTSNALSLRLSACCCSVLNTE